MEGSTNGMAMGIKEGFSVGSVGSCDEKGVGLIVGSTVGEVVGSNVG